MPLYNRVKFATATPGAGSITVGSALVGFRTPAGASVPNGGKFTYVIEDGSDWEIGEGTYTSAGTTVARSLIESSTGALLNLSGNAIMYIDAIATRLGAQGSWTPALTFGGGSTGLTYSTRTGRYTRVFDLVNIQAEVILSNKGSSTGLASLGGLPFTAAAGVPNIGTALLSNMSGMVDPKASVGAGGTAVIFFDFESNVFSQIDNSAFTNNSNIYLNLWYQAA